MLQVSHGQWGHGLATGTRHPNVAVHPCVHLSLRAHLPAHQLSNLARVPAWILGPSVFSLCSTAAISERCTAPSAG